MRNNANTFPFQVRSEPRKSPNIPDCYSSDRRYENPRKPRKLWNKSQGSYPREFSRIIWPVSSLRPRTFASWEGEGEMVAGQCLNTHIVLDARLVSSCLSWPSRARPRLSLLSASVGFREKTLLRVNPGDTPTLPVQSFYFPFRRVTTPLGIYRALLTCKLTHLSLTLIETVFRLLSPLHNFTVVRLPFVYTVSPIDVTYLQFYYSVVFVEARWTSELIFSSFVARSKA